MRVPARSAPLRCARESQVAAVVREGIGGYERAGVSPR